MFTLAHLSDPHLAPLPRPTWGELAGKRALGYLNWVAGRKSMHVPGVLELLVNDIKRQKADHIATTGDLINIALADEFDRAATWLASLGDPDSVTLVPGNHDAYVEMPDDLGLGLWRAYMTSNQAGAAFTPAGAAPFPFVRRFGDVALIGLSTAFTTLPFMASGRLGEAQLKALPVILNQLKQEDLFRIILIHHPPLPGQTSWRRALHDATALCDVLRAWGAELVLFGHNHTQSLDVLESSTGPVPIVGAPSASCGKVGVLPLARYNYFRISRRGDQWLCEMVIRGLARPDGNIERLERVRLRA